MAQLANLAIGAIFIVFPSGTEYEKVGEDGYCDADGIGFTGQEVAENHGYTSVQEMEQHVQVKPQA